MNTNRRLGLLSLVVILVGTGLSRWSAVPPAPRWHEAQSGSPTRVASLTLGTDELLSELIPPERVVCVTYLADDREISNVPNWYPRQVARLRDTDLERIIGLNPDLVCVAPYNSADFLKVLERSGLPVYRNDAFHSMDQIEGGIIDLGKRLGESDRAQQLVARIRDRRRKLAEQLSAVVQKPRVLFWSAGFTAGRLTTIDDIIREAGGINVAVERNLHGSAEISPEIVIAANPDFVLLSRWSADEREGHIAKHPLLRNLPAVREKRVIVIEGRYLTNVSHFVVEGAERLARRLHPDRFGADATLFFHDTKTGTP